MGVNKHILICEIRTSRMCAQNVASVAGISSQERSPPQLADSSHMPTSVCVRECVCLAALISRQIKSEELAKTLPAKASSVPHAHTYILYTLLMGVNCASLLSLGMEYVPTTHMYIYRGRAESNSLGNSSEI